MTYYDTENLRLEIEVPTEGLPNLVPNPSGDLGTWGWETPVANTSVIMNTFWKTPQFKTNAAQAAHWTSEFMPIAAGRYVGARFDAIQSPAGVAVRARYEWFASDKTYISASTQSGLIEGDFAAYYVPTAQAPVNAAFVKIRFDLYRNGGTPAAGDWYVFKRVMVTHTATVEALTAQTRGNLITNPSFTTNTTGWVPTDATLVRANVSGFHGTGVGRMTAKAKQFFIAADQFNIPVVGGKDYTASAYIRKATSHAHGRGGYVRVVFFDADGKQIGGSTGPHVKNLTTAWSRVKHTVTAPTAAVKMMLRVCVYITGSSNEALTTSQPFDFDAVLVERGTVLNDFYEGTQILGDFPFSDTRDWQNILGPTYNIEIETKSLDVGTLNASIKDALLDPAVSNTIRPGKRIRLMGFDGDGWTSRFTGRLTNAHVTYPREKKAGSKIETHITITATDNISVLANQGEARGVEKVNDLPFILEGKGVPWNVNGSGNQISSAQVISYNADASILDQIAVTRDSNMAHAWVDRFGVLNAWDKADLEALPVAQTFSDTGGLSYSDIDVDFNLDRCINEVNVTWLRYNIGTNTTEEISYGPYVNPTSQETWGPRSATFTKQGPTEDAGIIQTFADAILTANANPTVQANSLVMPVRNENEFSAALSLDLYSKVHVTYDDKVDSDYFISGMTHTITASKWNVTLTFDETASVESPQWTPSPPFDGVSMGTAQAGFVQAFAGSPSKVPNGWLLCDGSSFLKSQYPALAEVLGDTWGTHSGDVYYLPDLRQRVPVGVGPDRALGTTDNLAVGSRTPAHNHGAGSLSSGSARNFGGAARGTANGSNFNTYPKNYIDSHDHNVTGTTANSGGWTGGNSGLPHASMHWIIKV